MSLEGRPSDRLEKLQAKLQEELAEWHKLGMDPGNLQVNGFLLEMRIKALSSFLISKGLATQEELEIELNEVSLDQLIQLREELAPKVQQQRMQQLIVQDGAMRGLPTIDRIFGKPPTGSN